jgi:hypothetical protein
LGYAGDDRDEEGKLKFGKVPDSKKNKNMVFGVGGVGIPLPQEAIPAYVMGNAIGDYLFGEKTAVSAFLRMLHGTWEIASPLSAAQHDAMSEESAYKSDLSDYIVRPIIPTILTPSYDFASNRDTFGRAIIPNNVNKKLPMSEQYTESFYKRNKDTVLLAEKVADNTGVQASPHQYKHLANFLGRGQLRDLAEVTGLANREPDYEGEITKPIFRRFLGNTPNDFNQRDTFDRALARLKDYEDYRTLTDAESAIYGTMKEAAAEIRKLSAKAKTASDADKKEIYAQMASTRAKVLKKFNTFQEGD